MTILITGVAGLIGSHIAKTFINQGQKVIGVDNLSGGLSSNLPPTPNSLFRFFKADLTNYNDVKEIFMGQRPEVVYHCASIAREGASEFQPYKITASNMFATSICLELAIKYGMKRWVQFSSMAVYGNQKVPFSEEMPRKPVDPYGVNKAAIEQIIEQLSETHEFEYVILRPHNIFGIGQVFEPYRNVVTIFMNRIMRQEPIYLYGKDHIRAFSYIDDCVPSMIKAASEKKTNKQIVNVGGADPVTVRELIEFIISQFSEYKIPEIMQLQPRPHEVKEAWCTVDKSESILGYKEKIGWREGIKITAEWAKRIGPQKWVLDNLPLLNEKAPKPWVDLTNGLHSNVYSDKL